MFKKNDPYKYSKFIPLQLGTDPIGTLRAEYEVTNYENVQLCDAASIGIQGTTRQYLVQGTQTINLYNLDGIDLSPSTDISYLNYPLLLNTSLEPESAAGITFQLLEYSPQTVNTKVQQSGSTGQSNGQTSGVNSTSTVGSSTAQTNSYGASVTLGESPSASANYEHSTSDTSEQSKTSGTESSGTHGRDSSASATMSVKDWGAYALVNPALKSVIWTFGQEFPWDAVECRLTNNVSSPVKGSAQVEIVIPTGMSANLYDGVSLYPPSHLSTFGINFVTKAMWLVSVDSSNAGPSEVPPSDSLNISHFITYYSGSHMLVTDSVTKVTAVHVYMDKQPAVLQAISGSSLKTSLDLGLMALDAVGKGSNSAIVGFIPRKFSLLPAPFSKAAQATPFEIFSSSNNLLIKDTTSIPTPPPSSGGFTPGETSLTATLDSGLSTLSMTLYFKVLDADTNYALYLKHWVAGVNGIKLTVVVNGDTEHAIKKYVSSLEAEGGEKNLSRINLRDLDYSSVDYADYLQLGLNSIEIQIQPIATDDANSVYQLRAVSIERE